MRLAHARTGASEQRWGIESKSRVGLYGADHSGSVGQDWLDARQQWSVQQSAGKQHGGQHVAHRCFCCLVIGKD